MTVFMRRLRTPTALTALAVAGCVWLAVWIADEVAERETLTFDRSILEAIHHAGGPGLVMLARVLSALGPPVAITIVTIVAALVLWRAQRRSAAVIFALGSALTGAFNTLLKDLFARARPDLWPHPKVPGDSFPSGHAMQCAMVYGLLAILAARRWPRARLAILPGAAVLVLAIASSRAVLGVHWPTDLIAGLAIGCVCGCLTLWAIDAAERRAARTTATA